MDNKNLRELSEAYSEVYSNEYDTQVEEYTKDIFLVLSESLIQQGYSAVDVLEYFNEVEEETILEDFISLIDGDILTESVVPEYYIQEQYDILAEGIGSAIGGVLAKGAQKVGGKIVTSLKGKINPQAISAVKNAPRAASLAGKVLKAGVQGARYPASASPSGLTGKIGNAIAGSRGASALSAAKTSLGRSIQQGGGTLKGAVKNSPAMGGQLVNRMKSAASNVKNVASSALNKIKGAPAAANTAGKAAGGGVKSALGRVAGPAVGAAIDTANERSKGSGWGRSLAKGAIGAIGTGLGAAAGTAVAPVGGTLAGGMAGNYAAGKAFDVAAGANAKDRAQMANKNRSSQAGGKIVGTGGNLTVNKAKNAITTGVGPNRRTVGLSKTQAINTPGKGQETGYLAYKGGKPVYKRAADPSTLSKTSTNAFERIGRTFNPNAYKASDAAAKSAKLKTAQANTATYKKNLGVKEDFEYWADSLFDEGYDLSNYTWEGLFEVYCEEFELDETLATPSTLANIFNNNRNKLDNTPGNRFNPLVDGKKPTAISSAPNRKEPLWGKGTSIASKPSNSYPVNLPTSQKIQSGMQVYNAQRSAGDMKGAASTGMGVNQMKYGANFAKPKTPNPLMNKTFGYQTGNSPKDISKANAIVSSGQVAALKPATPAPATPIAAAVRPTTPTPQKRNQAPSRAPITQMNSYDFGSPDKISQDVASLYQSIYEGKKKVDQDKDGDNDFADVRIARMIASGVPKEEAIRRTRNNSYNEETELDEGRSENIRNKMVARYGKPDSDDTLRLHVARKKYDKAATKHQRGYGPNPRTEIKGKLNPGQLMYKAGQSANVNKEDFELWVNDLLDEGYDLSEYTVEEIYEIFEETALERKKAEEERKNERRARVAEMQAQGRVMTPAKRAAAQRAAKAAEKREAELEKAAQAALNSIRGATGKVSEKPMGSEAPESKKAAPEATRRLRTGLKRDTLGSAADAALKAIRNEDFELWVNELLDEGYDLSDYTWDELYEGYKKYPAKKVANKINRMYDDPNTDITFGKDAKRRNEMMRVYSHMKGEVHPLIRSESPKKSKAKEKENRREGEMKEEYNAYNLVIGHLLDEGFADDYDSANMMIERMSDEWLNEILESKN